MKVMLRRFGRLYNRLLKFDTDTHQSVEKQFADVNEGLLNLEKNSTASQLSRHQTDLEDDTYTTDDTETQQEATKDIRDMLEIINAKSVHVIQPVGNGSVQGIATLGSQLFILYSRSQQVHIYNTTDFTLTGHVIVSDINNSNGIVACSDYNCLYISDFGHTGYIHRVELTDSSVTKWSVNDLPVGLSVTRAHNLLVTLLIATKVHEYTTHGELIRVISLHDSIVSPCHSIELSTGQLAVSHGLDNSLHRVL